MANQRRIDHHLHLVPPFYNDVIMAAGAGPTRGSYPPCTPELGLELMDANDIEIAITSIVPGVHFLPPQKAREIARRCNEFSADVCTRWPKRYGAFAEVPMHDAKDAIAEIDYALDVLKLDGVYLLSSYGKNYLGDSMFDPVLDVLNQREAVVFIHPFYSAKQLPNSEHLHQTSLTYGAFLFEYPFDTTRMAAHLMFSGTLERFPRIRFILAHEGGALPYLAWRFYCAQKITPQRFPQWSYEKVREVLRHFYYDTAMSAGPEMTNCLLSMVGQERVVFGSDWPFVNPTSVTECVKNLSPEGFLSDTQSAAISRNNALALFPRLAQPAAQAASK